MNLAFCIFKVFPYGGLQRDFLRVAQACLRRGHQVTVFTREWVGEKPVGMHIHEIAVTARTNHGKAVAFVKAVLPQLNGFDRVIGFNRMPGLDVYFAGDVCYQAEIAQRKPAYYRLFPRYRRYVALEKAVFNAAAKTKVLVLSNKEKETYQQYCHTPDSRFHLLMPGIEPDRIPVDKAGAIRVEVRSTLQLADDTQMLLMCGSDFKRKGVDRAIEALASLPAAIKAKARLYIIGKGKQAPLMRLAASLGVQAQVKFLGEKDDAPNYMLAADVLLHPARVETAGMVLLEAIVAKLPTIVTANCGYAYLVAKAQSGKLLDMPYQQAQFNEVLANFLQESRSSWRANAARFVVENAVFEFTQDVVEQIERD